MHLTTTTVVSIILNIILIMLLFFKSALNDILKEWWIDRKKKKEVALQRLVTFKTKFTTYQAQSSLNIISWVKKQSDLIMGKTTPQSIENMFQNSLDEISKVGSPITELADFLPPDLKSCYTRFNEQYVEIIREIIQGQVSKEDLEEYIDKMKSLGTECTNLTDSIIKNYLH